MAETWLPFAIKRPGPEWKQGYTGVARRNLAEIEGEVKHSYEGYRQGGYSVLDGPRQSSWTFTIYQVGPPEQHYPLEAITWHAGLPGDRKMDTSLIGNLTLIGEEHEGDDEPLTNNQVSYSLMISEAVRGLCPHVAARRPALRVNLWEHGWLSPTSCPSGRIPWERLIGDLQEEDMNQDEFNRMFREAVRTVPVEARDEAGKPKSGTHPVALWLEWLRVHSGDAAKHGGGGEHTHKAEITVK